jgi:hypothetical protein
MFMRVLTQQPMAKFKISTNVQKVTKKQIKRKQEKKQCNTIQLTKKSGLR